MRVMEAAGTTSLTLPAVLDFAAAEGLHRMLQESLAQEGGLTLQGGQVERVSTACLQVLVAASRTARARGVVFALEEASEVLSAGLADLGLADKWGGEAAS